MATQVSAPNPRDEIYGWAPTRIAHFPGLRVLAWDRAVLYASRGYTLLACDTANDNFQWRPVANYKPEWWRKLTASAHLSFRLFRDGFHALAVLGSGHLIGAVPGGIVRLLPGEQDFQVVHKILRGTRPLHVCAVPGGPVYWGEYFDNSNRDEVHIYGSHDQGASWSVAYTFPKRAIRHVHNIVYDEWEQCLWVLTGDNGAECRILRASFDFKTVDVVLAGNQQARAAALVTTKDAVYFASDTPSESNHVYRLGRAGNLTKVTNLTSSSIYGCRVGESIFFSTMVEPSDANRDRNVRLFGSPEGSHWASLLGWRKDRWPMTYFQYGNVWLPDGPNTSGLLALTTIAVADGDLETSIWRIGTQGIVA